MSSNGALTSSTISKKILSRFREKCVTDRQMDGWIDNGTQGYIDRTNFIGPFQEVLCRIMDICQAPKYTNRVPKIIYENFKKY